MVRKILIASADYFHVPLQDVLSDRRNAPLARARQIATYLAKQHTTWSLPRIGREFDRDHTTILHSICAIEGWLAIGDPGITAAVIAIDTYLSTGERNFPALPEIVRQRSWDAEDIAKLEELYRVRRPPSEIARELKRSPSAVRSKAHARGFDQRENP